MNRTVSIAAFSELGPDDVPDVSFVPPLQRRRLSPLQRMFFALARAMGEEGGRLPFVFASRDGEDTLTRRIVADYRADGSVSPNRFSSSVHNAAPGLWSVFSGNRAPYTAIAAGDDTVECAILEALGACQSADGCVCVCAEETRPAHGFAALLRDGAVPGLATLRVSPAGASAPDAPALDSGSFARLCRGSLASVRGKWISLSQSSAG